MDATRVRQWHVYREQQSVSAASWAIVSADARTIRRVHETRDFGQAACLLSTSCNFIPQTAAFR